MIQLEPADLVARYDVILLDSYGVLVDENGAFAGAADFLHRLTTAQRRWMVISNDASRLPHHSVHRYHQRGLPITEEQLLTSGDLIAPYFASHRLAGARCVVLGPPDSHALVAQVGGQVVAYDHPDPEVVVVCDDAGYPFRAAIETLIGTLYARFATGSTTHLVLPNPDRVYPRSPGCFGLTAGSVARLLEDALALRFTDPAPRFDALGKPHALIFEQALARLGVRPTDRVVMIGDQLATDIAGAQAMGIDSVLVATGVCDPMNLPPDGPRPTAWMRQVG